ncbi:MAP7 domain-containing protein 2a isoform X2 [Pseudoliparis swirei]|uniref:MAP7 domain-containing protein 2a isoform X2 n=1 Tax=Pseudoliparis swirei TaxID=2059687 RepID=UPI0024BEB73F|nr:MAP7 domain-containing protein 2a isoform X2 [Pseudoliparis swirei]
MAKTATSCSEITGEKMSPPSITLLLDKKSPTNGHGSPARTGRTTPSNTEKKPQINGHVSPSHINNNHAGKQIVEGYMKTDDRMRLAKERREERERSLVAREQLIREKERRARLQYERTVEERWRRLDEQRQKEELRRAAVEGKRRQQLEEDRERLEALMKRSLERSLQLEQRTKRWSRGCPAGAGDSDNAPLPFSAASAFPHGIASPLPAVSESAPCSPHRSPFRGSLNPADHNRAGLQGGSQSTPNTPKKQRLRRERRTASPGCGSPLRRSESPASVPRHLASPATSKLASKMRSHSPSDARQYHHSPTRQRSNPSPDAKTPERHGEPSKAVRKNTDINATNPSSREAKGAADADVAKSRPPQGETLEKHLRRDTPSPDRKEHTPPNVDFQEKKMPSNAQDGDKKKESAPCASAGKAAAAGITNAEEATRVLAERRRQARAQKVLEEKRREREEEDRYREEQLKKQLAQERRQQEAKAQQLKEEGKKQEDLNRMKQEEDTRRKEEQEKLLQRQMDKEKEKAQVQAQEDADRLRQDRELQAQQEEEERQRRKKRIEEIMKRTRKGEADLKEEQVETKPAGEVKTVQTNAQVNEQVLKKVEFQVKGQVNVKEKAPVEREEAARMDNQKSLHVKNNGQLNEEQQEVDVSRPHRAHVNAAEQTRKKPTAEVEGGVMNGAVEGEGSASKRSHPITAEVSRQRGPRASSAAPGESRSGVLRPSVAPLSLGHLSPPSITLKPLDVKGTASCDEPMEVSPAAREELISIPEFSPLIEMQHGGVSDTRALQDLMDLTGGGVSYAKRASEGNAGDCNKNLIEGVVSPMVDSKLIGMSSPSSNKMIIQ